jgi:hypothetical protein
MYLEQLTSALIEAGRIRPSMSVAIAGALTVLAVGIGSARAAEFKLIAPIAMATVEGVERFVAADAFKPGHRIGGRTLSAVGWNFAAHFLKVVEENVPPTTLRVWSLQLTAGDVALVRQLGGENRARVASIAQIYRLMEASDGPSHTDGRSNIAYVLSPIDQRLWAVHWSVNYSNEWTIGAVYVPHEYLGWRAETLLLSPDCTTASFDHFIRSCQK